PRLDRRALRTPILTIYYQLGAGGDGIVLNLLPIRDLAASCRFLGGAEGPRIDPWLVLANLAGRLDRILGEPVRGPVQLPQAYTIAAGSGVAPFSRLDHHGLGSAARYDNFSHDRVLWDRADLVRYSRPVFHQSHHSNDHNAICLVSGRARAKLHRGCASPHQSGSG